MGTLELSPGLISNRLPLQAAACDKRLFNHFTTNFSVTTRSDFFCSSKSVRFQFDANL